MSTPPNDPFPRDRVAATLHRLPSYLRLAWRLARDPLLSRARRAAVVGAAGYLASPVDLVPGVIPIAGQLDDLAVAIGALKFALAGLDADRRREHLDAVGLEDHHLVEDLRTAVAASAWIVRTGARTTVRVVRRGGSVAKRVARQAGPATRNVAQRARPATADAAAKAGPAVRSAATRGIGAIRSVAGRRPSVSVRVVRPRLPALGAGDPVPTEERLPVEPDPADTDPGG
jgi:uncharacterized membrane protein YkvA (DUF1232 family)